MKGDTVYIVIEHDDEDDNIVGVYADEDDADMEAVKWTAPHGITVDEHEVK